MFYPKITSVLLFSVRMFKHEEALCPVWREKESYVNFIVISGLFQSELLGPLN